MRSAADGTFELSGVEAGNVTLKVDRTGYRSSPPITFVLGEDEAIHEENLLLEELPVKRTVVLTDARGFAVAGAMVIAPGTGPDGYALVAETDHEGRATVHLASPEVRGTVFAIPRSGSFGFARLSEEDIVDMRVMDSAALDLKIESIEGDPIPRVAVMMKINGTRIPSDVVAYMAHIQGFPLYSDESGHLIYPRMPPGYYELYPIATRGSSQSLPQPVYVSVLPGPQTVIMKFKPK